MNSNLRLEGKVAIITGGANGIGKETAYHFVKHGARAVVIADIQDEQGKRVANSIDPKRCVYIHCDVTDEQQVKSLVESTIQTYGTLDIMFSNAGIVDGSDVRTILDFDIPTCNKVYAVNARGMAACVKYAARAMVEKGVKGSIICTASVAATIGSVQNTDYTMSKHAVLGLVRSACKQLGEYGIRVNCVSPGLVLGTKMVDNTLSMMDSEMAQKVSESMSWLKGVITTKNVADAVVFLASEDAACVSGHNLLVDGAYKPSSIVAKNVNESGDA